MMKFIGFFKNVRFRVLQGGNLASRAWRAPRVRPPGPYLSFTPHDGLTDFSLTKVHAAVPHTQGINFWAHHAGDLIPLSFQVEDDWATKITTQLVIHRIIKIFVFELAAIFVAKSY